MANRSAKPQPQDPVRVYGWLWNQPREGLLGTVVAVRFSEIGERICLVVLDAPEEDGVCLVDVAHDEVVRANR